MKKNLFLTILITFFICIIFYYCTFSYYRQKQFEEDILEDSKEKLKILSTLIIKLDENIDLCNFDERKQRVTEQININLVKSYFSTEEYVYKKQYTFFIYRLFDVYGKKYSLERVFEEMNISSNSKNFIINNLNERFLEWSQNNSIEENCWEEFLKSDEYNEFKEELKEECENPTLRSPKQPKDKNIHETYNEIMSGKKYEKSSITNLIAFYHILDVEKKATELAYENYKENMKKDDLFSAFYYSQFIFNIWGKTQIKNNLDIITYIFFVVPQYQMPISILSSYLHIDILLILIFSTVTSLVVTLIVWKRYK